MIRTIAMLLVGLAIGILVSQYDLADGLLPDSGSQTLASDVAATLVDKPVPGADDRSSAIATANNSHEEREHFYQQVSQANESELIALIKQTAALPPGRARQFSAEILLSRFAEIDPKSAIDVSRQLGFDSSTTAGLYAVWAQSDADAALQAITDELNSNVAKKAALLLVEELGGDHQALLTVLDFLPPDMDELTFQIDVLVDRSDYDPGSAIASASGFADNNARARALGRLARHLSSRSPRLALDAGNQIEKKSERQMFEARLLSEWSIADPDAVFDYLATVDFADADLQNVAGGAIGALARADPQRLVVLADQWSGRDAERARSMALSRWARTDPQRAIDYLSEIPNGRKRDELLGSIAQGYAQLDPEGALIWAEGLQPKPRGVLRNIISEIAAEDFDRGFEIALGLKTEQERMEAIQNIAMRSGYGEKGSAERTAAKLLSLPSGQLREQALNMLGSTWAQADSSSLLSWLSTNGAQLSKGNFLTIAQRVAHYEPAIAAKFTNEVPASSRAEWIAQVARGFADSDPAEAMNWLSQYQGEPGFDSAVAAVVQQSAHHDPEAAARSIGQFSDPTQAAQIAAVASQQWASRDPESAAKWAASIQNDEVRNIAVSSVANQWANTDAERAAQWAMTLPAGQARDSVLQSVVAGMAATRGLDESILSAFNDDLARQQAVVNAVYRIARSDRAEANRLIEKYVTDPTLRTQTQRNLLRISSHW